MVQKTYVIDNVSVVSDRRGTHRLVATIQTPDVMQNGMIMPVAQMPLPPIEIDNPTESDKSKWIAGATVTATFDVTLPPATPAANAE